jgi:hypothetical protein
MSQIPQQPYGSFPQMPPGQMPYPPGNWAPSAPPVRRTSAAAITSLVFGFLGCIPVLGGLLAVIFGMVGLSATRNGRMGGRGLATAGLILGLLSLVAWGGMFYWAYQESQPAMAVSRDFFRHVGAGKIDEAVNDCTGDISRKDLEQFAGYMKQRGEYKDFSITGVSSNFENGRIHWTFDGDLRFDKGEKSGKVQLTKVAGKYKIRGYKFE